VLPLNPYEDDVDDMDIFSGSDTKIAADGPAEVGIGV